MSTTSTSTIGQMMLMRRGGGVRGAYDTISNIAAMYGTRLLLTLYTGDLLRIRRSSDDSEQDFGYDSNGDLDTAAIATFVGGGSGYVVTWYDQSGNGIDLLQSVKSNQPTFISNGLNGKPSARSTGGSVSLDSAALTSDLSQPNTVFVVCRITTLGGVSRVIFEGINTKRNLIFYNSSAAELSMNAGNTIRTNSDPDADIYAHILDATYNGASSTMYQEGRLIISGDAGAQSLGGIRLMLDYTGGSPLIGDISEVVVIDGNASSADRLVIRSSQANHFKIGQNLAVWNLSQTTINNIHYRTQKTYTTSFLNINQNTQRDNGILSALVGGNVYQVASAWNNELYLTISIREMPNGAWGTYTYDGTSGLPSIQGSNDAHNVANIGVDPDGILHISYDMHGGALNYARSDNAINLFDGSITTGLSMLGTNETQCTYPMFFNDPSGTLYFFFRDGVSGLGDWYIYMYDESAGSWSAATGTGTAGVLLDGKSTTPDENAYPNGAPVFDSDFGSGGYMHISWCWRETSVANTNHDIGYVKWDGTNWYKADGSGQTIPITTSNDDVLDAVAQNSGLSNSNNMALDSQGRPHIVYIKNDGASNGQIYHAIYDSGWTITKLTDTASGVWPAGGGSYAGATSRPEIAIDTATDTAYVIYRDDNDASDGILAQVSDPGDFTTWTKIQVMADNGLINGNGDWEPYYDLYQWKNNKVLYLPFAG